MYYSLSDYFNRMTTSDTEQQKQLWAKLFVRHWVDLQGLLLERENGHVVWCRSLED